MTTMIEKIRGLLFKYISLSAMLDSKGGRTSINNLDVENIYNNVLTVENEILKSFGLPQLMKYREILFDFIVTDNSENEIMDTITLLTEEANKFLLSSPPREIDILRSAKLNGLKTYDVLPEIGIEDGIYAMFVFEEIFKKDGCSENQFISTLKEIDETTYQELGRIHYNTLNGISAQETNFLTNKVTIKQVKYLKEFIKYTPVYPY